MPETGKFRKEKRNFVPCSSIKPCFYTLLLVAFTFCVKAQDKWIKGDPTRVIDSTNQLIRKSKEDTSKVKLINDVAWYYCQTGQPEKAAQAAREAIALAEKLNFAIGKASGLTILANVYERRGDYQQALQIWFQALKIGEQQHHLRTIGNCYHGLGIIYDNEGHYDEALRYHRKALAVKKQWGDKQGIAASYNELGNMYYYQSKWDTALAYYDTSLLMATAISYKKGMRNAYVNKADVYALNENYPQALINYKAGIAIAEQTHDREGLSVLYKGLASLYSHLNDLAKAKEYLNTAFALAKEIGSKLRMAECYEAFSNIAEEEGRFSEAFDNYKLFVKYRDSLMNEENTRKTVEMEMQYEFAKKESATKAEQERKDALAEADKKKHLIILLAVSGFGLLVLGFAVFAYRSFLQKKRVNEEITAHKHLIEEKQKEILDSIYYARRIQRSLLPNEKYVAKCLKKLTS